MRRAVQLLFTAVLLLLAPHATAGSVVIGTACGGTGFAGTYSEGGNTVHFESCPTPDGVHVKIWKPDDSPILELLDENGQRSIWVGGVLFSQANTPEERLDMASLLMSPDTSIAASVAPALQGLSMPASSPLLMAMMQVSLLFEDGEYPEVQEPSIQGRHPCSDPRNECFGCCGKGCDMCSGICTQHCLNHDACVRQHSIAALECDLAFELAHDSLLECYNYQCDSPNPMAGCTCCCGTDMCDCHDFK